MYTARVYVTPTWKFLEVIGLYGRLIPDKNEGMETGSDTVFFSEFSEKIPKILGESCYLEGRRAWRRRWSRVPPWRMDNSVEECRWNATCGSLYWWLNDVSNVDLHFEWNDDEISSYSMIEEAQRDGNVMSSHVPGSAVHTVCSLSNMTTSWKLLSKATFSFPSSHKPHVIL